ncbi:MAG: FecR family protein, partial [Gammaproteobacteria bacterium]|nr:FecR family protein [Gammaproteobacteria bacterium]
MSSRDPEEEQLQALLAEAGRREQPPTAKQQQFEAVFRRELQPVVAARRQRRRSFYAASAAVVVLAAGVAVLLSPAVQPPIVVAEVVSAVDGNQTFSNGGSGAPLIEGSSVHMGQTVRTSRQGMLALVYRNADVRLNRDTTVRFHAARIELIDGTIYVDTGNDRPRGAPPVVITTPLGSFSHVGTQFMVDVDNNREVTAAVREGTIRLRTDNVQRNFGAAGEGA